MSSLVLDASALVAAILKEPGSRLVEDAIADGAVIGSINLSEVIARLARDFPEEQISSWISSFELDILEFDEDLAWLTARLVPATRPRGLSLGDRACLALASVLGFSALTADRNWANLDVGVEVVLCR